MSPRDFAYPEPKIFPGPEWNQSIRVTDKRGRASAEGERASDDGEGAPTPPSQPMLDAIDFIRQGDTFWVRGVLYQVIETLPPRNAVVIQPVELDRATKKRLKKAGRSK